MICVKSNKFKIKFLLIACCLTFSLRANATSEFSKTKTPHPFKNKIKELKLSIKLTESLNPIDSFMLSSLYFELGEQYENRKRWLKSYRALTESVFISKKLIHLDTITLNKRIAKQSEAFKRTYRGNPKLDLDGWPASSFHLTQRKLSFPNGMIGVALPDDNGNDIVYETPFAINNNSLYHIDFNVFGVQDNSIFSPFKNPFFENLYGFYSVRTSLGLMPGNRGAYGFTFIADFGLDGGLMFVPSKYFYVEMGIKTAPLAMTYTDLGIIPTDRHAIPGTDDFISSISIDQNQYYIGAHPYFRTGIFLKKKEPTISIDLTIGYHFTHTYARSFRGEYSGTGAIDLNREQFLMNGRPIQNNTFSLDGRMIGLGVKFIFN
jgi:hypothetical protein